MRSTDIILKPLITEKATFHANEVNRYGFQVARGANKLQIRHAVEDLYDVRVLKVATRIRKGQMRRNKFGYWKTRDVKQAIVKVHPEDRIELF